MNILDVVILLAALAYAVGGYRSGAVVGIFSLVGFLGGAVIGGQLARPLGTRVADGRAQVPVAIVCVLVFATIGQLAAVWLGGRLRERVVRGIGRPLDAGIGAVLGVVSVLLVSWMIAVPLASSPYPNLASEASQSKIVRAVNGAVPDGFRHAYSTLRVFFDRSGFPPVFGDLPNTSIVNVQPPPALSSAVQATVDRAHRSVFKILGQAPQCNREIEGSGFVYARHRILTNAHVVAGTDQVQIVVPATGHGGTRMVDAKVVLFDPGRDVAVLAVPDLDAPALSFRPQQQAAQTNAAAVVLGFPENGGFDVQPARVRSKGPVGGRDIYDTREIERSIYSIRALVRSGNSGGPLIDTQGLVLGMVFATALDSSDTGFALADDEIDADAAQGKNATRQVGTQGCTQE
ncbi:MarP family serine protease [uncultured Jatrophihabitans sp.]|uniref:MarP family serine protease n=1 Tax=uncultured Jatrophihabitans sp. TaxID=1610747 RepID=UPI0035CADA5F